MVAWKFLERVSSAFPLKERYALPAEMYRRSIFSKCIHCVRYDFRDSGAREKSRTVVVDGKLMKVRDAAAQRPSKALAAWRVSSRAILS